MLAGSTLGTENDSIFIHEVMRAQITFLLLAYCFSGAPIGAFLHTVRRRWNRKTDRQIGCCLKG